MKTISTLMGAMLAFGMLGGCAAQQGEQVTENDVPQAPTFTREEIDTMSTEEKLAVYNEHTAEDKDRLICTRRMVTGSHRRVTECRTVEERAREKEAAEDLLREARKHGTGVCRTPPCN